MSNQRLTVLVTNSTVVFLIKDVRLQRIHIHDVSSTAVPMASIVLAPCLLTRDNFDNRSWCTHDLVANKSDLGSLGLRGIWIVIAKVHALTEDHDLPLPSPAP